MTPHSKNLFQKVISALTARAVMTAIVIGLFFNGWVAWQIAQHSIDRPLPPERITAKQLRVNEKQRLDVESRLTTYSQPKPALTLPPGLF